MAFELPHWSAAWRRQIIPAVVLAIVAVCASAAPASAARGGTVSAATGAVPGAPQTVQQTVDTTLSTVQKVTPPTPLAEPVADVAEPVRAAAADTSSEVGRQVTAPGAALPSQHSAAPPNGHPRERGAVGKAGALVAGANLADLSTPGATGMGSLASTAATLAGLVMPFQFLEAEAHASSTSRSGGSGDTDHPLPGAPGGTTGGLSGPIGFVLIAVVLAAIFGLAPRFLSTPLHMSSFRGHAVALALPVERPD